MSSFEMIYNYAKKIRVMLIFFIMSFFCFACSSGSSNNQAVQPNSFNNLNPQYQPQYAPPPRQDGYYYSQPYYNGGYQYQYQPASRYYNNPYAVPPQNQYPYYDGDQYYVPPTSYGTNRDNAIPNISNQKF